MNNFKKISIFILLLALTIFKVEGQVFPFFNHLLEDPTTETEYYNHRVESVNNKYFVAGLTINIEQQDYNKIIWILDSIGSYLDTVYLDTSNNISSTFVSQSTLIDSENNFVLAYSFQYLTDTTNNGQYRLVKMTSEGELLWQYEYGNDKRETLLNVCEAQGGGYLMLGYSQNTELEEVQLTKLRMIRVSNTGEELWDVEIGWDGYYVRGFSAVPTEDNGFVIGAGLFNLETLGIDNKLLYFKIDSFGNIEWEETQDRRCGTEMFKFPDGSYLLQTCDEIGEDYGQAVLIKMDSVFNIIWEKAYDYETEFFGGLFSKPILKEDGSFIATVGELNENNTIQCKLASFDSEGEIDWMQTYDTNQEVTIYLKGLTSTADGGYLISGTEWGFDYRKGILIKTDCMGNTCSFVGCDSIYIHNDPINPPFCEPRTCFAQIIDFDEIVDSVLVGASYSLPYLSEYSANNFSNYYLIENELGLSFYSDINLTVYIPDTLLFWGINIYSPDSYILDSLITAQVNLEEIKTILDDNDICYSITNNPLTLYIKEKPNGISFFENNLERIIVSSKPNTTTFTFPPLEKLTQLKLYDGWGRLVETADLEIGHTQKIFNISLLPNGIYYWRMGEWERGRFVKM